MAMREVFRIANRSFSSWRKICRLSGVTFTSTHSENTTHMHANQAGSINYISLINPHFLTWSDSYVQGNKWILMSVVHVIHFIYEFGHLQSGNNQRSGRNDEFWHLLIKPLSRNYLQGVTRPIVNEKELPVCGAPPNTVVTLRHKTCDPVKNKQNNNNYKKKKIITRIVQKGLPLKTLTRKAVWVDLHPWVHILQ